MSTLERLICEARALPFEEQQKLIEALGAEDSPREQEVRVEAVRRARGSMRGVLPSVTEFLAEKHAELNRSTQDEGG
jgi:enhancing lycopene biosynthesis protein 2